MDKAGYDAIPVVDYLLLETDPDAFYRDMEHALCNGKAIMFCIHLHGEKRCPFVRLSTLRLPVFFLTCLVCTHVRSFSFQWASCFS